MFEVGVVKKFMKIFCLFMFIIVFVMVVSFVFVVGLCFKNILCFVLSVDIVFLLCSFEVGNIMIEKFGKWIFMVCCDGVIVKCKVYCGK